MQKQRKKQKHFNCDSGKRAPWQKSMPYKQEALISDPQNLLKASHGSTSLSAREAETKGSLVVTG